MTKEEGNKKEESYELESSNTTSRNVDLYIGQNFVTNGDRLHKIISKNISRINVKPTNWELPASIFITFIITLTSSEFVDRFYVSKHVWLALTIVGLLVSAYWLYKAIRRDKKLKEEKLSVEELVSEIKKNPTGKIKDF